MAQAQTRLQGGRHRKEKGGARGQLDSLLFRAHISTAAAHPDGRNHSRSNFEPAQSSTDAVLGVEGCGESRAGSGLRIVNKRVNGIGGELAIAV